MRAACVDRLVASKLGIEDVHAEVLPEQEGDVVAHLQAQGRTVAACARAELS